MLSQQSDSSYREQIGLDVAYASSKLRAFSFNNIYAFCLLYLIFLSNQLVSSKIPAMNIVTSAYFMLNLYLPLIHFATSCMLLSPYILNLSVKKTHNFLISHYNFVYLKSHLLLAAGCLFQVQTLFDYLSCVNQIYIVFQVASVVTYQILCLNKGFY